MRKKIFIAVCALTLFSVFVFALLQGLLFNTRFSHQIKNALATVRITVFDFDGNVLYDNYGQNLENHANRPEFIEALQNGKGKSERYSQTFAKNAYYYAVKTNNNTIIRLSVTADSIRTWFFAFLSITAVSLCVVVLFSLFAAQKLTQHLITPINKIDLNNISDLPYEELKPFAQKIENQKKEISAQVTKIQTITHTFKTESEKRRKEFSANVSHELKTPLTAITALSEMIASGIAKQEDIVDFAQKINSQSQRLLTLINDIIKLSEFDEGIRRKEFEKCNIADIIQSVAEHFAVLAELKKVHIKVTVPPLFLTVNKRMFEELVFNLVDNAVKYNKENGSVTINAVERENSVIIQIKDTGIGISAEHQVRIFERFYRVDKSRSKQTGGTGLGLSIVKHIVEFHNGTIELESKENEGTIITLKFFTQSLHS